MLQVTHRIQNAIIRVLKEEHRERQETLAAAKARDKALHGRDAGKCTIPISFPFVSRDHLDATIQVSISLPHPDEIAASQIQAHFQMRSFIRSSQWAPVKGKINGTSWLELFIAFQLLGGRAISNEDPLSIFEEKNTLLLEYRAFKRVFLNIVHTCVDPECRFLFAPSRVGLARLSMYGITSHVPCIRAERYASPMIANLIHRALVGRMASYSLRNV